MYLKLFTIIVFRHETLLIDFLYREPFLRVVHAYPTQIPVTCRGYSLCFLVCIVHAPLVIFDCIHLCCYR